MPLTSDIRSHSFNLGVEVVRARIVANGRGDITVGGETFLKKPCLRYVIRLFVEKLK